MIKCGFGGMRVPQLQTQRGFTHPPRLEGGAQNQTQFYEYTYLSDISLLVLHFYWFSH